VIELRAGSSIATIDPERGGRLAGLSVDGRELIVGPPDGDDRTILWGSFLMAPWCGRIAGAAFEWRGDRHTLNVTLEPHAIHGTVWDRAWTVESATDAEAVLTTRLGPGGWPFAGSVRQRYALGEGKLITSAEILAEQPMPAALGWHPWFVRDRGDARLTVLSSHTLETEAMIPTGRRVPVDGTTDLRHGTEIGARLLDHCYTEVRSPALVEWPALRLEIAFDELLTSVVVHSRAASFCVEPETAWPNPIALEAAGVTGTGLVTLQAGERLAASMTWSWQTT
jgi:galactose mutarotase-like enzyme